MLTLKDARQQGVEISFSVDTIPRGCGNQKSYKLRVPYSDFEQGVIKWLNGDAKHKARYGDWGAKLSPEAFLQFVPDFNYERYTWKEMVTFDDEGFSPYLKLELSDEWFILEWFGTWMLGFREENSSSYDVRQMPTMFWFDNHLNIIGDKIIFLRNEWPWPFPLENPDAYLPYGRVNYLLTPRKDNPITILCRSPQPYRGFGHMFKAELEELRQLMYDCL